VSLHLQGLRRRCPRPRSAQQRLDDETDHRHGFSASIEPAESQLCLARIVAAELSIPGVGLYCGFPATPSIGRFRAVQYTSTRTTRRVVLFHHTVPPRTDSIGQFKAIITDERHCDMTLWTMDCRSRTKATSLWCATCALRYLARTAALYPGQHGSAWSTRARMGISGQRPPRAGALNHPFVARNR
jgi:hypothetical protein